MRAVHVLAHDGDPPVAMVEAGVDDDALAVVEGAGAVGAEDARLGHGREPLAHPEVEMVQRRRAQVDEDFALLRRRVGRILVAQHLWPAVLVNTDCLHRGRS